MRHTCQLLLAAMAPVLAREPARACRTDAELKLEDIKFADVVVVGRITNYRIILDQDFRRKMLALPNLSPDLRQVYETGSIITDYAKFDVQIDEVLFGGAPRSVSVTWDNSTFGEPKEMAPGPFLIAMRDPTAMMPPLRGPSATIFPNPERDTLTVVQAPCSSPFIFESGSDEARTIRQMLGRGRD